MARGKKKEDLTLLEMALVGYQVERRKIDDKMRQIEEQLGDKRGPASAAPAKKAGGARRVLSAAARARIAAAQRKRWAEHRKRVAAAAK